MPNSFKLLVAAGAGLNLALWLAAWLVFPADMSVAVLHYSPGVGIDFIGEGRQIMALPLVGLAVLAGNCLLAAALRRWSTRASFVLLAAAPTVQVVLLVAVWLLRNLNL